jgi:hypothetical protein
MTRTIVKIYHLSSESLRLTNEDNMIDFVKGTDLQNIYLLLIILAPLTLWLQHLFLNETCKITVVKMNSQHV